MRTFITRNPPPSGGEQQNVMKTNTAKPVADAGKHYVVGPVSPPPVPTGGRPPAEFLRLPPPGQRCPFTGLTRSFLNNLILPTEKNGHKPPVRSFVLRQRGKQTGVRLIDGVSLFDYIRRHEDTGVQPESEHGKEGP